MITASLLEENYKKVVYVQPKKPYHILMRSNPQMEQKLSECSRTGLIVPRTENNPYLKVSYRGAGDLVSDKWNVKIYTSRSVVCNDPPLLSDLINGRVRAPDTSKKLIQIDDSGWGFPLLGTMVGGACEGKVVTDVVDVFFQEGCL